jgi:hypothetical protein
MLSVLSVLWVPSHLDVNWGNSFEINRGFPIVDFEISLIIWLIPPHLSGIHNIALWTFFALKLLLVSSSSPR